MLKIKSKIQKSNLAINPEKEVFRITAFLRETIARTELDDVVLGWSGGIDSTVCLFLLAQALPTKNIHVLHLPYKTSFMNELTDSAINELHIPKENIHEISIRKMVDCIWKEVHQSLDFSVELVGANDNEKIRLGNIMARIRMITLFDFSKKISGLVCGTENKTEHYLGYFTRYGDAASDIEPIISLYKTQIYQLATHLSIPDTIVNRAPSANLWEGQTDEGEFGFSYQEAD